MEFYDQPIQRQMEIEEELEDFLMMVGVEKDKNEKTEIHDRRLVAKHLDSKKRTGEFNPGKRMRKKASRKSFRSRKGVKKNNGKSDRREILAEIHIEDASNLENVNTNGTNSKIAIEKKIKNIKSKRATVPRTKRKASSRGKLPRKRIKKKKQKNIFSEINRTNDPKTKEVESRFINNLRKMAKQAKVGYFDKFEKICQSKEPSNIEYNPRTCHNVVLHEYIQENQVEEASGGQETPKDCDSNLDATDLDCIEFIKSSPQKHQEEEQVVQRNHSELNRQKIAPKTCRLFSNKKIHRQVSTSRIAPRNPSGGLERLRSQVMKRRKSRKSKKASKKYFSRKRTENQKAKTTRRSRKSFKLNSSRFGFLPIDNKENY